MSWQSNLLKLGKVLLQVTGKTEVNVRDFIQKNYTPYEGDESFLVSEGTEATNKLWAKVMEGIKQENSTHAPVDFDTSIISTITAHDAGYIEKDLETIVGLQTDAPLKRAIIPNGGIRMVEGSCKAYDRELDPQVKKSLQNTVKLTTLVFSTSTLQKS